MDSNKRGSINNSSQKNDKRTEASNKTRRSKRKAKNSNNSEENRNSTKGPNMKKNDRGQVKIENLMHPQYIQNNSLVYPQLIPSVPVATNLVPLNLVRNVPLAANYFPIPSTSRAIMPQMFLASNVAAQPSTSGMYNVGRLNGPHNIMESSRTQSPMSVKNNSRGRINEDKNSSKREKFALIKEMTMEFEKIGEVNCSIHIFNNLKRTSKNIWKSPKSSELNGLTFINSQLTDMEISKQSHFGFDFTSVHTSFGFLIRKKSSCKFINLKSFVTNNSPLFVWSNFSIRTLSKSIKIANMKVICPPRTLNTTNTENSLNEVPNNSKNKEKSEQSKKTRRVKMRCRTMKKESEVNEYPEYLKEDEVKKGLEEGSLIKGFIRINIRNHNDAYVTNEMKGDTDYFIKSVIDQNRALDGDEVVLKVKPPAEWEEGRKTASVVYISQMVHPRTNVGNLVPLPKNENFAEFCPRDKRFPTLHIPSISWPQGFKTDPKKYSKNVLLAKITDWKHVECAKGLIIENIGIAGDLRTENLAILKNFGLDHELFSNDLLKYLPKLDELQEDWLEGREDLRNECVFTIDPLTARDLDDAMSCRWLPDGNLEIGVHIADVAHFLTEGTELDKQVQWKATTIYMVEHVYHMLPVELCMSCSLLPGKDKLSFSVFWTMTPDGEILNTRFAKTVINSCAQLAYEHAQAIIDDPENFDRDLLPKIANGRAAQDIERAVLKLYDISRILRRKRFENGALRINQIKLSFDLDPENGLPTGYRTQEMKEANRLIEEFMLLANISVATKILDSFPDIAFLRLHEPPKESMMKELKIGLESVGIHVDISSAKSIQSSLLKYGTNDYLGKVREAVLSHLLAKPMTRARYFCPGTEPRGIESGHYALNIPLYTHFTSPIRRYADIMVHRLLEASLEIEEKPEWEKDFVSEVAERCNTLKYNAKKAQEESIKMYLGIFISNNGPFVREAAVVDVKERAFDVMVLDLGEIVRVYVNLLENVHTALEEIPCTDLDVEKEEKEKRKKYWRIKLSFPPTKKEPSAELIVELFTLVKVELKMCKKKQKLQAKLLRPSA